MSWSNRHKRWNKDREKEETADWIDTISIDEAIDRLRQSWKNQGLHAEEGDWATIQLAHIAIMRGRTRRAAPLVVRMLERRQADGNLKWHLDASLIGAVGVSVVRLMASYLEDPAIPIGKAWSAVDLFLRSVAGIDALKSVHTLMPLIAATRLEPRPTAPSESASASKLPLRSDMEASGMCPAAHRQWRVEYLLKVQAEDEALDLAHKGRSEKSCTPTCGFAPHSMYAWLLEPLHRRQRHEEARVLDARLESLMTPRLLYLNAMGHRIAWLALEGRFADASHLLHLMLPIARDPEASPWQQLQFYSGCERALQRAGGKALFTERSDDLGTPEELCAEVTSRAASLRQSFATRSP